MSLTAEHSPNAFALHAGRPTQDFTKAVEFYTRAIELESDNNFVKKLYCNRASANQRAANYSAALEDADAAIGLDAKFYKGHWRRADALWGLARRDESAAAYTTAAGCADVPAGVKSRLQTAAAQCKRKIEELKARRKFAPRARQYGAIMLNVGAILFAVLYLLPGQASAGMFYRAIKFGILANVVAVYESAVQSGQFRTVGYSVSRIWNAWKNWFPREMATRNTTHHFFPYLVVLVSRRPIFIAALPMVIRSALRLPALLEDSGPLLSKLRPLARQAQTNATFLRTHATRLEVLAGFMLLGLWIVGQSSMVSVIMYWQYLRMSYIVAQVAMQQAPGSVWAPRVVREWAGIRAKIDGVFNSAMCPGIVRSGYQRIIGFLSRMTDPQQAAGGGMMSACSIM